MLRGPAVGRDGDLQRRPIRLAVSIDTECDKGPGWKTQFPLGFRSVVEGIPNRLIPLFRKHGIVPTFLLSPEILRDPQSVATLREIRGCELGTHLHGEFIEPQADLNAAVTSTPQFAYGLDLERQKIRNLTGLFQSVFSRQPLSFRAGRFALGSRTLAFLEEIGYLVDSSVTPFRTNEFGGKLRSNYWGAPLAPYHPSPVDPRRKGTLRLLEVPVTIFAPALARWPSFVLRRLSDRALRLWPVRMLTGGPIEKMWVRPLRGSSEQLVSWSDAIIAAWRGGSTPVLNVMFHSVETIPGASPYAQTEGEVSSLLESLDRLFAHLNEKYRVDSVSLATLAGGSS